MLKRIFIFGIDGNMGRRYRAILKNHLCIDCDGYDTSTGGGIPDLKKYDGFVVATPTSTHLPMLKTLFGYQKPILVEKPLTTDLRLLDSFESEFRTDLSMVQMVNQYAYLQNEDSYGPTSYDYFKTGGDGLYWDCLNIIGLAKERVEIDNRSAVWNCTINGYKLSIENMDRAYIAMIRRWTSEPQTNWAYAAEAHLKTARLMTKCLR